MFTGIVAAIGEVRECRPIGDGHDMRLVIGVAGERAGAPGTMRAGGLLFLPPVASGPGVGAVQGVRDCVREIGRMLEEEGQGLGALVRLAVAVAVAAPAGAGTIPAALPGTALEGLSPVGLSPKGTALEGMALEGVRAALAAALPPGGPVPAISVVRALPDGAAVQAEAVATAAPGAGAFLSGVATGASIACSGCCLTVVGFGADWFAVEASAETLSLTTLGRWTAGTKVNLERALRLGDELGGHMVSGHVDGLGEVVARTPQNGSLRLEFALPRALARFVATKGSIAVDGVSLTVNSVRDGAASEAGADGGEAGGGKADGGEAGGGKVRGDEAGWGEAGGRAVFGVNVIPHTAGATTLGLRRPGEAVHIEVDGVARNAARLADPAWADPA